MAKNLGEHPLYSNLGADSIVVTMINDDVSPMTRITRYEFDSWNDCSSETTIRDSIYITDVLDSLKKCDVISILSHRTDEVVMNMEVFYKGNMYWSRWLSDDIVDIRCRLLIYKNNKISVVWLSDNGEFDFDIVKCSGGRGAYKLLKRLVDGSSHNDISDYVGNVRCVVREDGELCESNGYYPYGMAIPYGGDIQPYKYGEKELERMHGIGLYDSRARWYDPALGRTTTMDSEAGTYPGISPYLWCAANPIRFTDPSGSFLLENFGTEDFNYPVVAIFQSERDETLQRDYEAALNAEIPVISVDDVDDLKNALEAIKMLNIACDSFTINSHGNSGSFEIGSNHVTETTDLSDLSKYFSGKMIFIGACNVGAGIKGTTFTKYLSAMFDASVITSLHPVPSGYDYRGSNGLSKQPYATTDGDGFLVSNFGGNPTTIRNVVIEKNYGFRWNPANMTGWHIYSNLKTRNKW